MGRIVRETQNTGKLTEIGKIKIGDKALSQGGKEYPVSLDYFRATGDYSEMFKKVFGDKCTKLPITFPSDDIDSVCNEHYELRDKAGKLVADGDGETWKVYNQDTEKCDIVKCSLEALEAKTKLKAKVKLTLRFLILDIKVLGLWRFETYGSASSIPQIRDTFDFVMQNAGTIVRIPFDLQVKRVKSQRPGKPTQYSVVSLVPNLSPEHAEKLYNFLESGAQVRGLLTADRIEMLQLGEAKEIQQEPEPAPKHDEVEFEEIDTELESACISILECTTFDEVKKHWQEHKKFQSDPAYQEAKNKAKENLENKQ